MAGDVAGGLALDLGDEDPVRLAADPVLDPAGIEGVATLLGEVAVVVEAGIDVVLPGEGGEDRQIPLLRRTDEDVAGLRRRRATALQRDTDVHQPESLPFSSAGRLRICG